MLFLFVIKLLYNREVDVKIVSRCYGKPTSRMISEAVHIQEMPEEHSLNSKAEWTYVKLPRVAIQ